MTKKQKVNGKICQKTFLAQSAAASKPTTKQFEMYALAACLISKCHFCVKAQYDTFKAEGMTTQELMSIGSIAAVVNAIGKVSR